MRNLFTLAVVFLIGLNLTQAQTINEFHYDNAGGDVGEFVEVYIADPQPSNLSDYRIDLYNGSNGTTYDNETLDNLPVMCSGGGCYYTWTVAGIQNGAPDGIALTGPGLVEFLSYEGSFTASNGPASGTSSTDVGVSETSSTPTGTAIAKNAMGDWETGIIATPGAANSNALPISLTSFTASKKSSDVALNWSTATEVNNDYFIIEHSRDGYNFRVIGEVKGAGTTEATQNYSFDHDAPAKGSNYYRLQQVDYSRAFTFSSVESVMWDAAGTLEIYPTLISDHATVVIDKEAGIKEMLVHDLTGRLMISESTNESGNYDLDLSSLANGTYLVSLRTNSSVQTTKVVKQ